MPHTSVYHFLTTHLHALGTNLLIHIALSFSATLLAIIIGLPLGVWAYQKISVRRMVLAVTNIFQTIPSLALLAFLIPMLGIGFKPTIVTLMLYALLPITRNTYIGLSTLPEETIEAAKGLGFTRWQRLSMVELPLATPTIIAGIRTATAMTIGITTIAAFIGAGGLGTFITEGLALNSSRLILLGAIPTALLALLVDYLIAQFEIGLSKQKRQIMRFKKIKMTTMILLIGLLSFSYGHRWLLTSRHQNTIVVATKNFTESYILGWLMADLIRSKTHLHVVQKFNLGSTAILQNALLKGDVDLYPEYTGTAYLVILKQKKLTTPQKTYQFVKENYKKKFHLIWLKPFGFSNSQTLAVRTAFAKKHHLKTLSDLASISNTLTIAAPASFIKRPDDLPGLQRGYDLKFKKVLSMQPDLVYNAIYHKSVDVIEVFTTDVRTQAYHLTPLIDDKHIYPPYDAAPVLRSEILKIYPKLLTALAPLAGLINKKTMRALNAKVELQHQTPKAVAHQFLVQKGLLPV